MKLRSIISLLSVASLLVLGAWFVRQAVSPLQVRAQEQNQQASAAAQSTPATPPQTTAPPLRSEANVVRVDVIVTDKKGKYVQDLTSNDFKLYEDNREQKISNFSFGGANGASPHADKHYMVLFFDDSTMDFADQPRARDAAAKFVAANSGPDRVIAVVEFGGTLQVVQNFTSDPDLLRRAVAGVKFSAVAPNAPAPNFGPAISGPGGPTLVNPEAEFGAYTLLLSLRSLAQSLARIPGRKTLVLFTAGFPITPERESELTATIDACNKANVAVYPLDVRGLVAPNSFYQRPRPATDSVLASFHPANSERERSDMPPHLVLTAVLQRPGGGGGSGGGTGGRPGGGGGTPPGSGGGGKGGTGGSGGGGRGTGGSAGGGKGGGGGAAPPRGTPANPYGNPNYTQPRVIVPTFPPSATTNQQIMYELAAGTGGFPILNTNDLLSGLQKIGQEQNEYYLLGFAPLESTDGSCHTLKVKVDRHGTEVRARSGYCNVQPKDVLAGKPIEKELEAQATSAAPAASTGGTIEAPFFYTAPNEARVNLVMDIPPSSITFDKVKGKYHADLNVLGIASKPDGSVGARFSDEVTLDLEKDEWEKFKKTPMHYENQFTVVPGKYSLTVVLSGGGQNFGKYETPLAIDPYDGKALAISAVALSNDIEKLADVGSALDADLLSGRTPLVFEDVEIVPSGTDHFKKTDSLAMYAQIYDPHLEADAAELERRPPDVKIAYRIVDVKTGKTVLSTGAIDASHLAQKGSPIIPIALKIPLDHMPPGSYRLDVQAEEQGGTSTPIHSATFVED
ncbi:MAG TPA: VWA domain-containing protein [Candidatus Acidoferrum sp.]|nr:VWA domain-containing protein [Candidatus Acidoferrum sp.]